LLAAALQDGGDEQRGERVVGRRLGSGAVGTERREGVRHGPVRT
jgi:hypothetical protein